MADLAYPKRPAFFAAKFVRKMIKMCVAQEHGQGVFTLLAIIAHTEDARQYIEPVTWWNEQLASVAGFANVKALDRQRQKAIDAGWLGYIAGGKSRPGRYWVMVPERYQNLDDRPTDEGSDDDVADFCSPVTVQKTTNKVGNKPGDNREVSGEQTGNKVGNKPGGNRATFLPNPNPNPVPDPEDPPNPPQGGTTPLPPDGGSGVSVSEQDNPVRLVFEHYRKHHPRSFPKPSSNSKEWKAIRARLNEGYTVADLCEAIDGCHKSPWHCGENERNRPFQALELIVRSADKVNQFVEIARKPVAPVLKESEIRSRRAVDQVLSKMFPKGGDS